jgi:uncharacterized protein (DUF58 family)
MRRSMNLVIKIFYYIAMILVWIVAIPVMLGIGGIALIAFAIMLAFIILFFPLFWFLDVKIPGFAKKSDEVALTIHSGQSIGGITLSPTGLEFLNVSPRSHRSSRRRSRKN